MAFWGIEVKPGKPITHSCESARGRLRISQATLGIGEATKKSVVQCNVGKRSPVLLCALLPNKTESCHLDLEFEEADDVVFSVIGPRSVYLTGYYVQRNLHLNDHSDTESYGVDIENTQTEGSSYCSDDDKYEDSFINDDDDLKVSPESPVLSNKGMNEVTLENKKPKEKKDRGKQLKKKFQVIESDDDSSHESEDEDGYSLSVSKSKRTKAIVSDAEEKTVPSTLEMHNEAKGGVDGNESDQKVDPLDINNKLERVMKLPLIEEGTDVKNKLSDVPNPKEVETLEENPIRGRDAKDASVDQSLLVNGEDQMHSADITKPKKKRKERSAKMQKTHEVQTGNKNQSILREDKGNDVEATTSLEIDANYVVTPIESGSANGQKSKKRKKELMLEGTHAEGMDKKCRDIPKDDELAGSLLTDSITKDLLAANGEHREQHRMEGTCTEGIHARSDNMPNEDESVPSLLHADSMALDLPPADGEYQEPHFDNNISINPELLANDGRPEEKIKKKVKKTKDKDLNKGLRETTDNEDTVLMKYEGETANAAPIQRRTLSNGLIIEEMASGPPDGKVAAPGKKVKIYYAAMLKENGHVFDSNVGKAAFKFRLGDEEFIDGWNVGIDGMRVGDKRRLIIPPSMGFGSHGVGENVPPNSWLVYDIELVSVRR